MVTSASALNRLRSKKARFWIFDFLFNQYLISNVGKMEGADVLLALTSLQISSMRLIDVSMFAMTLMKTSARKEKHAYR